MSVTTIKPDNPFVNSIKAINEVAGSAFPVYQQSAEFAADWFDFDEGFQHCYLRYLAVGFDQASEQGFWLTSETGGFVLGIAYKKAISNTWETKVFDQHQLEHNKTANKLLHEQLVQNENTVENGDIILNNGHRLKDWGQLHRHFHDEFVLKTLNNPDSRLILSLSESVSNVNRDIVFDYLSSTSALLIEKILKHEIKTLLYVDYELNPVAVFSMHAPSAYIANVMFEGTVPAYVKRMVIQEKANNDILSLRKILELASKNFTESESE